MAHWEGREVLIHPISVRSPARAQVCIFSFFLSEFSGWGPKLVLIHQVPRSNPELPNFLSFSLSSRIVPPFRTNLLQDKRFRGGDRVQIHNHESHSWFGPPFASCEVMRSHYGPLGRTRGANPPDLSSIPGPCTSLHFFFLSFGVFGMGTQTGAHPPGPPFESRASKFSFFLSFF